MKNIKTMIRKLTSVTLIGCLFSLTLLAQPVQKTDTVIVNLAKASRIVFTIQDRNDLEQLKHYDFQSLFSDILIRIKNSDTFVSKIDTSIHSADENNDDDENDENENTHDDSKWNSKKWEKTWQSFNFDLGTNNYLSNGKFPDEDNAMYSVRPWGSWYVAINSIQRTKVAGKLFVEWGLGVSWYNFKFQKDNILVQKDDDGVQFYADTVHANFVKSKLTASYLNASIIPVIDFGRNNKKSRTWDNKGSGAFRIGLGPYVGYKIGSRSKLAYDVGSKNENVKNKDNFYLENIRYGLRLQVGFRSTDLFFNYDMNELFVEGKGPSLNALSFGVIL